MTSILDALPDNIALHLDPQNKKLLGVWMLVKDVPTSYYESTEYQRQLGGRQITARTPGKGTWNDWLDQLAQRTPGDIWWEVATAKPNETPKEAFARLSSWSSSAIR